MILEKIYSAAEDFDENSANLVGQNRRRAGMWISDAIYMPDVHKLVLASTSRDLRFFTLSSETFLEEFTLFGIRTFICRSNVDVDVELFFSLGLKNVPTCLDYHSSQLVRDENIFLFKNQRIFNVCRFQSENNESMLIFGDDSGVIHILYFKNPINSLFDPIRRKNDATKTDKTGSASSQRIFWDVSRKMIRLKDVFNKDSSLGFKRTRKIRSISLYGTDSS